MKVSYFALLKYDLVWVNSLFTSHILLKIRGTFNLDTLLLKRWNGKMSSQVSHVTVFPGDMRD